jgi:hypothetical protein
MFIFNGIIIDPARSLNIPYDTLAPFSEIDTIEFKEKFVMQSFLLAHEAVNCFIKEQIKKEKEEYASENWAKIRTEVRDLEQNDFLERVVIVKITGLLKHTGQFGHIGLSGKDYSGLPVIYIDSAFYNSFDNAVYRHEIDEFLKWQEFRVIHLNIQNREEMRGWIKDHIDKPDKKLEGTDFENMSARSIAEKFHKEAFPLDLVYEQINISNHEFDFSYIKELFTRYGLDAGDVDINLAGKFFPDNIKINRPAKNILKTVF